MTTYRMYECNICESDSRYQMKAYEKDPSSVDKRIARVASYSGAEEATLHVCDECRMALATLLFGEMLPKDQTKILIHGGWEVSSSAELEGEDVRKIVLEKA